MTALCVSATAAPITFGPFLEFKGAGPNPGPLVIPTLLPITVIPIPFDGVFVVFLRDRITVNVVGPPLPFPFLALTFVTFNVTGVMVSPIVSVTDLWAVDQNPGGSALAATGFDPASPQVFPISNEEFIGQSGTVYPATTNFTTTVGLLPATFPGFDLSAIGGNPASLIYAFQADIPLNDIVVPESGTAVMAGAAILVLLGLSFRRKTERRKATM
jgi:hypothetical protein